MDESLPVRDRRARCLVRQHLTDPRGAVPSARRVVDAYPRTATASPQAASTAHAAWLADASPAADAPATIEPVIATPSAIPVCRLADATEAATPAWLFGMPDTAVLEIGAFTRPQASPSTT